MPNARAYAAAAVGGDGLLYVFGGQPCVVSGTCAPLSVVEAFDGARWATRAPMPTPRAGLTAALGSDGHVHVAGGWNERGVLNVMEVYDPSSDTWTAAQPMATARAHAASARDSNGRIIVIGGSNAPTADLDREAGLTTVEAFDGRNGSWAVLTPLPTPLTGLGASQGNDGRIYVIGGQNDTSFFREVMAYNP